MFYQFVHHLRDYRYFGVRKLQSLVKLLGKIPEGFVGDVRLKYFHVNISINSKPFLVSQKGHK